MSYRVSQSTKERKDAPRTERQIDAQQDHSGHTAGQAAAGAGHYESTGPTPAAGPRAAATVVSAAAAAGAGRTPYAPTAVVDPGAAADHRRRWHHPAACAARLLVAHGVVAAVAVALAAGRRASRAPVARCLPVSQSRRRWSG